MDDIKEKIEDLLLDYKYEDGDLDAESVPDKILSLLTDIMKSEEVRGDKVLVSKSKKQIQLEKQGCVFRGQERLSNHEIDIKKECYCGRLKNEHI